MGSKNRCNQVYVRSPKYITIDCQVFCKNRSKSFHKRLTEYIVDEVNKNTHTYLVALPPIESYFVFGDSCTGEDRSSA